MTEGRVPRRSSYGMNESLSSQTTMIFRYLCASILACLVTSVASWEVVHGNSFVPDIILRISYEQITQDCQLRDSIVVNGTSPGPDLRIPAGKTTWIRVYNDMQDRNLTMVRRSYTINSRES